MEKSRYEDPDIDFPEYEKLTMKDINKEGAQERKDRMWLWRGSECTYANKASLH